MVNISQKLSLQQKQSPQQVLLSSLLQLPVLSLEQRIKLELETNPLLEVDPELEVDQELEEEPELSLEVEGEGVKEDGPLDQEPEVGEEREDIDWEAILKDEDNYDYRAPREQDAEEIDRPEVAQQTLYDHLLSQLHMTKLSEEEVTIGEYIVWNINEDGYLSCDVHTIAQNLGVDVDKVEKVLEEIQHFDPPGIGARNLQECLLIQLLDKENPHPLAIAIVRDHFDDFKNKRYEKIAKKLNVSLDDIRSAMEEITKLNPKPGEGYFNPHDYIVPDVIVERDDGDFRIILNDWSVPHLRINNAYKRLLLDKEHTPKETRDYIRQRLESARWLINSIHQRRMTIQRVLEAIVRRQRDFFDKGKEYIKPMILKDIADDIGMDISTVSRVTSGKYVQTEHGVFELKYFFSEKMETAQGEEVSNKVIKDRIRQIIEHEDPKKPLNDQKIAEMLNQEGFLVARRTVAKYREQMMIPVSRLRRRI